MSSIAEERTRRIPGFTCGYLFEAGKLTLEQLDLALERQLSLQAQGRALRLCDVLVELGVITRADLESALSRQSDEGRTNTNQ